MGENLEEMRVPASYVELDVHRLASKEEAHEFLARELAFPAYYGRNLDALADCLSEIGVPVTVRIRRRWHQPEWFRAMAKVIRRAGERNPYLTVI